MKMIRIILGILAVVSGLAIMSDNFGNAALAIVIGLLLLSSGANARRRRRIDGLSGYTSPNYIGLCSSCLDIQLHGMTVRGLVSGEAFDSFEGKLALLLHLKEKGGCISCIDKAKHHAKAFGGPGADEIVDDFYRNA
jgi:hypothetical protein